MTIENCAEKLFSYGTLRYETVQLSTFGRKLIGRDDTLCGYKLAPLKISDPDVIAISGEDTHQILVATNNKNDKVDGVVFDITSHELAQADQYEVTDYKRVGVTLHSGVFAWVYVNANDE